MQSPKQICNLTVKKDRTYGYYRPSEFYATLAKNCALMQEEGEL
jgi:hypothetical protein